MEISRWRSAATTGTGASKGFRAEGRRRNQCRVSTSRAPAGGAIGLDVVPSVIALSVALPPVKFRGPPEPTLPPAVKVHDRRSADVGAKVPRPLHNLPSPVTLRPMIPLSQMNVKSAEPSRAGSWRSPKSKPSCVRSDSRLSWQAARCPGPKPCKSRKSQRQTRGGRTGRTSRRRSRSDMRVVVDTNVAFSALAAGCGDLAMRLLSPETRDSGRTMRN